MAYYAEKPLIDKESRDFMTKNGFTCIPNVSEKSAYVISFSSIIYLDSNLKIRTLADLVPLIYQSGEDSGKRQCLKLLKEKANRFVDDFFAGKEQDPLVFR